MTHYKKTAEKFKPETKKNNDQYQFWQQCETNYFQDMNPALTKKTKNYEAFISTDFKSFLKLIEFVNEK